MTSAERLAKLAAPTGHATPRKGFRRDIGDGDPCVTNPEHGSMLTIRGSSRQRCPHQVHDVTRLPSSWPYLPHRDFAAASDEYHAGVTTEAVR